MMEIIFDPYKLYEKNDGLKVETGEDYIRSRLLIYQHGESGKIVVQNPGMHGFYDDLKLFESAKFTEMSPLDLLNQRLGKKLIISDSIRKNPGIIMDLNLMEKAKTSPPIYEVEDIEDWILYCFVGASSYKKNIDSFGELGDLIERLHNIRKAGLHIFVENLLNSRIQKMESSNVAISNTLNWLKVNPPKRAMSLIVAKYLETYPEQKKSMFMQGDGLWSEICQLSDYQSITGSLPPFQEIPSYLSKLDMLIKNYLDSELKKVTGSDDLIRIINLISGRLPAEIKVFEEYIYSRMSNADVLDNDVLDLIIKKFNNKRGKNLSKIAVDLIIPEKEPDNISLKMSWKQVKTIITEDYMPFYKWVVNYGLFDKTRNFIKSFEDWYINNRKNLKWEKNVHLGCMVRRSLEKVESVFGDRFSFLLVVIDGIGVIWNDYIIELCNKYGMEFVETPAFYLSNIPTLTRINKTSLLSGHIDTPYKKSGISIEDYRKMLAGNTNVEMEEIIVASDRSDTIVNILRNKRRIYLYLVNEIDEFIHESISESTRKIKIKRKLNNFFNSLNDGIKSFNSHSSLPLIIGITSDHGYTILPADAEYIPTPEGTDISHGRVASDVSDLNDINQDDIFSFTSGENACILAREYKYFGSKPRGAVHGGITPQEILVSGVLISTEKIANTKELIVRLEGKLFRGKKENKLQLVLVNPNSISVEIDRIFLEGVEPIIRNCKLLRELRIPVSIDGSQIKTVTWKPEVKIVYRILGEEKLKNFILTIQTAGAALVNLEFEDEFDV